MESLSDFVHSVTRCLSEEQDGAVGEAFCALVVGIENLNAAIKEAETKYAVKAEDGGESEAAEVEKAEDGEGGEPDKKDKAEEEDIIAIAWRVEYNLAQYIE